jgi:hypothetical protein
MSVMATGGRFDILRRDSWQVNMKKVYKLYKELGLWLRNKTAKRGQSKTPSVSHNGDPPERCVGNELCSEPVGDGPQAAHPDRG